MLAALVILGTVLSAMLVTRARIIRQTQLAQQKITACQAIEPLVAQWTLNPNALPRRGEGELGAGMSSHRMRWRCSSRAPEDHLLEERAEVVRIEVVGVAGQVLTAVELLVPVQFEEKQ